MDTAMTTKAPRKKPSRQGGKNDADGVAQPADGILAELPVAAEPAAPAVPAVPAVAAAQESAAATAVQVSAPIPAAPEAPAKAKKPKLVRGSYSMPEEEYRMLSGVKQACAEAGFKVKRADLLRIGVALIGKLQPAELQQVLAALPPRKPATHGRGRAGKQGKQGASGA